MNFQINKCICCSQQTLYNDVIIAGSLDKKKLSKFKRNDTWKLANIHSGQTSWKHGTKNACPWVTQTSELAEDIGQKKSTTLAKTTNSYLHVGHFSPRVKFVDRAGRRRDQQTSHALKNVILYLTYLIRFSFNHKKSCFHHWKSANK